MKISNETKVGALAVVALALLITGFNFLKGKNVFSHSANIYAVFTDLGPLEKSNQVKINGLPVGTVYTLAPKDKDVTGIVEGYEQRVTNKDGRLWLLVKASRDVTYSDGHHELENINMAVYPPEGETPDQISAARAIYQRETNVLYFNGNVKIDTKDKLKVNTDALSFDRNSGIAQTDSPIAFERENVSGTSTGAVLEQKSKRLELKKDVQLTVAPNQSMKSSSRSRPVSIKAAHGTFDQHSMQPRRVAVGKDARQQFERRLL